MALSVVYRQVARREILGAARIYEERRRELGGLFLDEIGRIEMHISDAPRLYQLAMAVYAELSCADFRLACFMSRKSSG